VPESDDNLRLQIGHVLFIDIVGYSKLLIEEQKERLNQLTEIVLTTATVRASTDEQLVRQSLILTITSSKRSRLRST
jgi:hypothetical protein